LSQKQPFWTHYAISACGNYFENATAQKALFDFCKRSKLKVSDENLTSKKLTRCYSVSPTLMLKVWVTISSTFYTKLLSALIPKAQKRLATVFFALF
jgi:hypothetical protein